MGRRAQGSFGSQTTLHGPLALSTPLTLCRKKRKKNRLVLSKRSVHV